MAFIYNIISPDEKLLGVARLHWIYLVKALAWAAGSILVGAYISISLANVLSGAFEPVGDFIFVISVIGGSSMAVFYIVLYYSTELGLTTQRCIYKRGLIFTDVREVDLEEIKSSHIDNGLLGRFLNYGYIHFDARFIEDIFLPAFADPYRFLKAINEVRTKLKDEPMNMVLSQAGGGPNANIVNNGTDDIVDSSTHMKQEAHLMDDKRYKSLSNNPAENLSTIKDDLKETQEVQDEKRTGVYVNEEALHDKVINAFEETVDVENAPETNKAPKGKN